MLRRNKNEGMTVSRQLAVASTFSIFALCALALFASDIGHSPAAPMQTGATIEIAAPALSVKLPFFD
jgi:hypothetical protein